MNIIFDLGGVVLNWSPLKLIERVTNNKRDQELLEKHLFSNPDWVKLDQGVISTQEVIENTVKRSGLSKSLIEKVFQEVKYVLIPNKDTVEIVDLLGKTDHNLYVLSNMHSQFVETLLETYNIWNNFKGMIFSCDVKMVKPNVDIYEHIIEKYKLDPNETIFIDDTIVNLETANNLKISTIHFKSSSELMGELKKMGVL